MLDRKLMIKIIIIIVLSCVIICIPNMSKTFDVDSSLGDLNQYGQVTGKSDVFQDKVGVILGAIQMVGSLTAVICLIVLGVRYMMGSVEEKAEYKKTLLPYFIGAMLVFGITNLLKVVYDVMITIT